MLHYFSPRNEFENRKINRINFFFQHNNEKNVSERFQRKCQRSCFMLVMVTSVLATRTLLVIYYSILGFSPNSTFVNDRQTSMLQLTLHCEVNLFASVIVCRTRLCPSAVAGLSSWQYLGYI